MTERKRRLLSLALAVQLFTLSGCGKSVNNSNSRFGETTKEPGEHTILKVDRNIDWILGSNGKFGIIAPKGYVVLDYDYDYSGDFEFHDYVFVNKEQVKILNPNNIGTPINSKSKEMSGVGTYPPGEHNIVDIDRSINLLFGKNNEIIDLVAPNGYSVIDYDYDKIGELEFENITYTNNVDVRVNDFNEFGTPIEKIIKTTNKGYYDIGEHKLVTINRNLNLFWGKNEIKSLTAPMGYKIVDYDYDKTSDFEFETITYENIVPVTKKQNDFGIPVEKTSLNNNYNNEYDVGEHVLVQIKRNFEMGFGFEGTECLDAPDGYELLDYDYDYNEDFEFQTYVYVNNKKVLAEDKNNFGKVLEKEKTLELTK